MTPDDTLGDAPFSYAATKSGLVQICFRGKVVTTLAGKDALRFLAKVSAADARGVQLAMAKATGHFKHGNEKQAKTQRT